jgi:hypothetical protein
MAEGLVEGEGFATDASIVKADAQRQRAIPGTCAFDWAILARPVAPIREYLAALDRAQAPEPAHLSAMTSILADASPPHQVAD